MAFSSLADFLEQLAHAGQLARTSAEVDPELEIAEITRRVAAQAGRAVLFDRVRNQSLPVVTNLLGTPQRLCLALGLQSLDELAPRVQALIEQSTPQSWFDRLRVSADDVGVQKFRPKSTKTGPCQQVVHLGRDVNLARFPLVKHWPGESGAAITAAIIISEDPTTHIRAATLAPLMVVDANRLALVDEGQSEFARHWAAARSAGQHLPLAIVLGGDPAHLIAAGLQLGSTIDVFHLSGLLRGQAVDLIKCRTHELLVPGDVDFVFEGYCDPAAEPALVQVARAGGGQLRAPRPYAMVHIAAVTHRSRPIFPVVVDGPGSGEIPMLVKVRERMLLAALGSVAPDVADLHLSTLGGGNRFVFVAIRKRFAHQARQVAAALWGTDSLRSTKFLVLVDHDVDVHDVSQVLARVGSEVAPERDVFTCDGPAQADDHANTLGSLARHVGIDATSKLPDEQPGDWPAPLDAGQAVTELVTGRWAEYNLE